MKEYLRNQYYKFDRTISIAIMIYKVIHNMILIDI